MAFLPVKIGGHPSFPFDSQAFVHITAFVAAFIVWLAGLTLFAYTPWRVLHRAGMRSWYIALGLAVLLTFPITFLLADLALHSMKVVSIKYGASTNVVSAALAALNTFVGVLVAFAVWLSAYRPWLKHR